MITPAVDFEMRGGTNPNSELDLLERGIAEKAFQLCLSEPQFAERGFKWAYNWMYFHTVWMARDPKIIELWYKYAPYPEFLELEVTQRCGLKCRMCEHTYWNEKSISDLTFKQFKYIINQFPNLKWLSPNALGDPFLNKDYWKMLEYTKELKTIGELYSNTSMLTTKDMKKFVKMGLEYFKFSLDSPIKKTYEKLRVGVDFDKVIGNLIALDKYKKKYNSPFPRISIHYLVTKETIKEAPLMLDFLHNLKINVDNVMFSQLLHYFKEVDDLFVKIPFSLCNELVEKGARLNIPVSFNADLSGSQPPINECLAWQMPYIFADGTVISCCCMNEQNRRWWQRETAMGNIFEQSFREIWNGPKYRKMRLHLRENKAKEAHPVCAICNIYGE